MIEKKYDVALVGLGYGANYGSMLTYYSIAETLKKLGKEVLIINKIAANHNDPEISGSAPAIKFAKKYHSLSKVYDYSNIRELNDLVDTFVVGTDQVWNYGIAKGAQFSYYLDFVEESKKKISIAASLGHSIDFVPRDLRQKVGILLKKFEFISVREDSAVSFLKKTYGVTAKRIIEPVFYTTRSEYGKLADCSEQDTSANYLLVYILDYDMEKRTAVKKMSEKLGLEIKVIPDGLESIRSIPSDDILQPEDFLKLFKDANFVITDSFHGTAFALKFNISFVSIINKGRGEERFKTLFDIIGNHSRAVHSGRELTDKIESLSKPLDFSKINKKLDIQTRKSLKWIKKAIRKKRSIKNWITYLIK